MTARPRVALFVTCLVDFFRPQVGMACAKLLEQVGCDVEVPLQSCCGQPAYNAGDAKDAAALARGVIASFELFDFVVAPSGSCAGMIKKHYPELLKDDAEWNPRAEALAAKTYELLSFLAARGFKPANIACNANAAYHDSCSSLREMKIAAEPRAMLGAVNGLRLNELKEKEVCCGFGGLFSLKYPEISARMADDKLADVRAAGAELIVGGDLGCLLHLAGRLARDDSPIRCRHAAEILAGMGDEPAIGEEP